MSSRSTPATSGRRARFSNSPGSESRSYSLMIGRGVVKYARSNFGPSFPAL